MKAALLGQFYKDLEDRHDNWKEAVMFVHIQPPYIFIHTVDIVTVRRCQMMIHVCKLIGMCDSTAVKKMPC